MILSTSYINTLTDNTLRHGGIVEMNDMLVREIVEMKQGVIFLYFPIV
jgi:hypothetical protein